MADETYVPTLPACNFCDHAAEFDAKTKRGPWANMCPYHFELHGVALGAGMGQRLIEGEKPEESMADKRAQLQVAIGRGDFDAAEDIMGDGDPAEWF